MKKKFLMFFLFSLVSLSLVGCAEKTQTIKFNGSFIDDFNKSEDAEIESEQTEETVEQSTFNETKNPNEISVDGEYFTKENINYKDDKTDKTNNNVNEESKTDMYRSELTNEWISDSLENQRPVAVMVDNEKKAWPHYGLAEADVVYELMNSTANDRITRFMALVKDWESIEQMGSIRSVRPTNILLAAEWNAILVHDGGPFYVDPYLANDYSANFSGGFSRVKNGKPTEFTEYVMTGDLDKKFKNSSYTKGYNKYYPGAHYKFSNQEIDLSEKYRVKEVNTIILPFKHTNSTLKYNTKTKTYDYYAYNQLHTDAEDDEVLSFKNVLIQECTFHQYDDNGYMIYNCIDQGLSGYYITNGYAIPITWTKNSDTNVTHYYDSKGNEIQINTGKTYITLVPDDTWDDLILK